MAHQTLLINEASGVIGGGGVGVYDRPEDLKDVLRTLADDSESDNDEFDLKYDEKQVNALGVVYQRTIDKKKVEQKEKLEREEEEKRKQTKMEEEKRKKKERQEAYAEAQEKLRKERQAKLAEARNKQRGAGAASASADGGAGGEGGAEGAGGKKKGAGAGGAETNMAEELELDEADIEKDGGAKGDEVRKQIQELQLDALTPPVRLFVGCLCPSGAC